MSENITRDVGYICVRRAGFDLLDGRTKGGELYYDSNTFKPTVAESQAAFEARCDLIRSPNFNPEIIHPLVKIAKIRIIEIVGY